MESISNEDIKKWVLDNSRKDRLYHILFWIVLYVAFVLIDKNDYGLKITLSKELINVSFYAVLVYINLYYLIPKYLTEKNFLVYGTLLILSAILITPIKTLFFYLVYSNFPEVQSYFVQNQRLIFLSSIFIAASSTIFQIINDWQKHQRERMELQHQTTQSELKFLKSQLNPHFLFNTLNNLYALTMKKSELAPEVVLKLSEMMRYMLYECNEPRVPLQKEVNYLVNYLELEKLRLKKGFQVVFEKDGAITDQKIAPLIFIPFLENSFKHGLNNQIDSGFIHIRLQIKDQQLMFEIENSKSEHMLAPSGKKSGGIGLVNIKRRLDLNYPKTYDLDISSDPNNYKISLELELDK